MAGFDPSTEVQRIMGHKNVSTLMRYAHLKDESKREAVAIFDRTPSAA